MTWHNGRLEARTGDITSLQVDAIVNAANSTLLGGGGVDGAIHRAGGPEILEACRLIRQQQFPQGLPPGEAVYTTAGLLPCKYVIHTVGPVWKGGNSGEKELLASAYRNSFELAVKLGVRTLAFPAISTGVYSYPADRAAKVVWNTLNARFRHNRLPEKVILIFLHINALSTFLDMVPDPECP